MEEGVEAAALMIIPDGLQVGTKGQTGIPAMEIVDVRNSGSSLAEAAGTDKLALMLR